MRNSLSRARRAALIFSLTSFAAACGELNLSGPHGGDGLVPSGQTRQEVVLDEVARGFAHALTAPEMRSHVRDAMRASPLTEHKVVLHEFVSTPGGQQVLEVAAGALGTSPAGLEAMIAELPAMDFYAPFREHRLAWQATPDVVVAAAMDTRGSTFRAFTLAGEVRQYDIRHGPPTEAVLMIHPAQRKSRRLNPQDPGQGSVIQDASDGELSGTIGWIRADGSVFEVELAALLEDSARTANVLMDDCYDNPDTVLVPCSSGGGGSPSIIPTDTTYLDYLWVNYWDGIAGSNELEFTSRHFVNGVQVKTGFLRIEGVYPEDHWYPHIPLIFARITENANEYIKVSVIETDTFFNDDKGWRDFYQSDRGETRSIVKGSSITNVELDWIPKY
jgi:hypothetical protein